MQKQQSLELSELFNRYAQGVIELRIIEDRAEYRFLPPNWDIAIFISEAVNAFAMPDSKVGVDTAVIGYEIEQRLMAFAGFTSDAVRLWQLMGANGDRSIELFSTHLDLKNLAIRLKANLATMNLHYQKTKATGKNPQCKKPKVSKSAAKSNAKLINKTIKYQQTRWSLAVRASLA